MGEIWDRVTAVQPPPSTSVLALTAAVAAALVLVPGLWPVARHAVTVAHEAGHAVVAALTGRRLTGIRLHADTSGLTLSRGRPRGPGMALMLLAGYPGPAVLGLGAAALVAAGRSVLLLWVLVAALALMLLLVRNLFGLWVVLAGGVGAWAVSWYATPDVQTAVACTLAWFWLLAAPRTVLELAVSRRRAGARTSDADQLATVTHVPAVVWVAVLLVVTVAAALAGTAILLPDVVAQVSGGPPNG
ncbi:M50 family metallopeptidase [Actinotalea fermentans]|uniref:Membrane protein n=1 Tax=Actinotalea fermentans TaxID=43671 RepID=A0A511YY57_9CELL|nr:M50 family metallopeptidase [Actinotalea fermentans]GEN80145.1 membrane protein [Actinotalea fermentans]